MRAIRALGAPEHSHDAALRLMQVFKVILYACKEYCYIMLASGYMFETL